MTAIMRAEHQDPEVARFIDSYKYDQQSAERRQKYGGGTVSSLHLSTLDKI